MNINADSIQKKEFHIVFKGYKPEEVDKFLDILTAEFDRLQKSQRELKENLEKLKYEGDKESVEMKRVIQEALVSAHKVAEDIKQKAENEAVEIVRNKIAKEEETYKNLLSKKAKLERDIKELNQEYEDFKGKISKLVDDFKETASKLGEEQFLKISEIGKKDFDIDKTKIGEGVREGKESIYFPEEELEVVGGYEKKEGEEKTRIEEIEEEREEEKEEKFMGEEEIEEEKEEKLMGEEEEKRGIHGGDEIEEREEKYEPKRVKKKIDIANPDIINDFFKTDED
jgi:cell division initiation protein